MSLRFYLSGFLIAVAAFTTNAADKRNITEKDLFDFVWIGDVQVSPDGARVAVVCALLVNWMYLLANRARF